MAQRTVKRISPDFKWRLGEVWHGYENPWPGPVHCPSCLTTGFNPETKKLHDTFRSWAPKLTRAEAEEILEKGVTPEEIEDVKNRAPHSDTPILKATLVEARAKRKSVWGQCASCEGSGWVPNPNPAVSTLYQGVNLFEEWEPTEPPHGSAWQLWSEPLGAPLSPIFSNPIDLVEWCVKKFKRPGREEWVKWVESFKDVSPPSTRPPFRIQSDHFKVFAQPKPKYLD